MRLYNRLHFLLAIMIFVLLSCSSKTNNTNTLLNMNDANVEFYLPKGFELVSESFDTSESVAHIVNTFLYKNSEDVILSMNYEKLFAEPYFYNELGGDDEVFNEEKLRMDGILLLAVSNANGNGLSSWNKKEITEIAGRKCIYTDFEAREKRNVSIIWLTNSLYFIEFFYQAPIDVTNDQLDSILESIKITQKD